MSVSTDRQDMDHPGPGWARRVQLVAIVVLALVFVFLTGYHILFKDRTFTDPELMRALQDQSFEGDISSASKGRPGDWPQWRGPNRDGLSWETGLRATWPADGPPLLWSKPVGTGYSCVAIAGGRAFTLMQEGSDEAAVCWNAETGQELWRFHYAALYRNSYGDGPRSTPTVDGERVYTVGGTGVLHCLKTNPASTTGEKIWRHDLLTEFNADNLQWGVSFSPLVDGGLVYTNPGGPNGNSIAAFDKLTGALKWKALDDQAGYSSPVAATIRGRRQVVFFTAAGLAGLTANDGQLLWRFPWETSYGANVATPIVVRDHIFVSSGYNRGCAVVRADGALASRVYENKNMRNHFSSCVLYKDHLYGFNEKLLTCLEFRTGKVKWRQDGFDKGSLLIADGQLIILGEYGKLALAQASPQGYRETASFQVSQDKCWTVPTLANGRLYVRDENAVMCFDLKSH